MTEETAEIQRLDYSKPPPGYEVGNRADDDEHLVVAEQGEELWSHRIGGITPWAWNDPTALGLESCGDADSQAEALAAAWAHYKTSNDPPGLDVMDDALVGWGFQMLRMRTWPTPGTRPVREFHIIDGGQQPARTAAWAWYDRRLAVAERLRSGLGDRLGRCDGLDFGPAVLTWSDEQVAEVERWLVDSTAEMPEVLRG